MRPWQGFFRIRDLETGHLLSGSFSMLGLAQRHARKLAKERYNERYPNGPKWEHRDLTWQSGFAASFYIIEKEETTA